MNTFPQGQQGRLGRQAPDRKDGHRRYVDQFFRRIDPEDLLARGVAKSVIMELVEERYEDVATFSKCL